MIVVIILGLLALFSLISFVLGTDEPRRPDVTPRDYVMYLLRFGTH